MKTKSTETPERRLMSYKQAAAYLGISERGMKELGRPQGEIQRVEIGSRVLFDRQDLDGYIDRVKQSA